MSARPEPEYLDATAVAERIGLKRKSINDLLRRREMPEPDLTWMGVKLWLPTTIDTWRKQRYVRRYKRKPIQQFDVAKPRKPPKVKGRPGAGLPKQPRAVRKRTRAGASELPLQSTVTPERARRVAAELRATGLLCTTADVMVLADHDGDGLEHERLVLRGRILRALGR